MTPSLRPGTRWLILTQYYAPEVGAAQVRLRAMVRELHRRGIVVDVLTAMPNYPTGRLFPGYEHRWLVREEIDGIPVTRTAVYARPGKSARVRLANYLSFTASALVESFRHKPDVLFVESQPLSLGAIALVLKALRGTPYIYNVPDLQIEVARQLGFMQNERFLKIATKLENRCLRSAWKVSTVSEGFIAEFERRGIPRSQLTFLPNGADIADLRPDAPCPELLERWNLHGKTVLLYLGTQAHFHGLDVIIGAAALLRDRPNLVFLFIGDGAERPRLEALARAHALENVIFDQRPPEERRGLHSIAYASLAAIRAMPVTQGMRLAKIFTSLSCGVPVIHAGSGEGASLLEQNGCGVVTPPENPEALAAAIRSLLADPAKRDAMAAAGRALIVREFSWPVIIDRWLAQLGDTSELQPVLPEPRGQGLASCAPSISSGAR
jgi:putative colanic acid biosynthesis glycosyltransferase WcaI